MCSSDLPCQTLTPHLSIAGSRDRRGSALAKQNAGLRRSEVPRILIQPLQQAIAKARHFGFDLQGAVMASDAFFPFPDCVEIAGQAGITSVVQPGGSVKDQESVDYCNAHGIAMVMTGTRHFKH